MSKEDDTVEINALSYEYRVKLAFESGSSIGKAQGRYSIIPIFAAAFAYVAGDYAWSAPLLPLVPLVIALCTMAWFGMLKKGGEINGYIKELVPDYNYAKYGGAPSFVWSVFYHPHGSKNQLSRTAAWLSYPVAFTLCMLVAWLVALHEFGLYHPVSALLITPSIQTLMLWPNRIKAILKPLFDK